MASLENLAAALRVTIVQLCGYESERLSPEQVRMEIDLIVEGASGEERMGIMRVLKNDDGAVRSDFERVKGLILSPVQTERTFTG